MNKMMSDLHLKLTKKNELIIKLLPQIKLKKIF